MSFNRMLGLQPGEDPTTVVLDTRPEHQAIPGAVHFAVLTTVAEVAAAQAAEASVVPTSVQVSLLRRAAPGRLVGKGKLLRKGRRVAFCEGEVFRDGELVAKATVQFALIA